MIEVESIDYRHYGDQLQRWREFSTLPVSHVKRSKSPFSTVDPETAMIFDQSLVFLEKFRRLGVRGFSYRFCLDVGGFEVRLKKSINLRAALFFDPDLFYPDKVHLAMRKIRGFHCGESPLRPIAFALGQQSADRWFVFQIQS